MLILSFMYIRLSLLNSCITSIMFFQSISFKFLYFKLLALIPVFLLIFLITICSLLISLLIKSTFLPWLAQFNIIWSANAVLPTPLLAAIVVSSPLKSPPITSSNKGTPNLRLVSLSFSRKSSILSQIELISSLSSISWSTVLFISFSNLKRDESISLFSSISVIKFIQLFFIHFLLNLSFNMFICVSIA